YVLIMEAAQVRRLTIGRLGEFVLRPGFYAYVGSACGAGGLRARVAHHLENRGSLHWHIDHLLRVVRPIEVWYAVAGRGLEKDWVELFEESNQWRVPIPRFGASDYRRAVRAHLFYRKRRPRFEWFAAMVRERLSPEIRPERLVLEAGRVGEGEGGGRR
ncbi:MAG: GIY-YIG nuclease family protein, partial [Verrucomicrobia bacterium]